MTTITLTEAEYNSIMAALKLAEELTQSLLDSDLLVYGDTGETKESSMASAAVEQCSFAGMKLIGAKRRAEKAQGEKA